MAKKIPKGQPPTIGRRFTSLERLVRNGFRKTESRFRFVHVEFRNLRKEMDTKFELVHLEFRNVRNEANERFTRVEDRIDRLATHVDGFMKLHETL
jgi:hypothetical protein